MDLKQLLIDEIEDAYNISERLIRLAEKYPLDWKPTTGSNWLTNGQLIHHVTNACGAPIKGFVTGDWGMPADFDPSQMKPEDMLPPAEKFPSVSSIAEALELLASDKQVALDMVTQCSVDDLSNKPSPAFWDPTPLPLGRRLLQMVNHLNTHKFQLFTYLKLQGEPVNTNTLYGQ
ncbi:MAG: DinB family protein [bacterium]|nr:DinB family protein [bacterium]